MGIITGMGLPIGILLVQDQEEPGGNVRLQTEG